ncbi:MAG: hypothetical protein Q4A41_04020, partial [Bacillota bacterium]|nr:hypothetical protein [Bacillota bacterium]
MKKVFLLLLCTILSLTSCTENGCDARVYDSYIAKIKSVGSEGSNLSQNAKFVSEMSKSTRSYKASDDAVITRTLTIIGAIPDYSVEGNIQSFVNAHPDVEIIFEQYKEQGDFFDVFPVLLMTKDYGDIVILQSGDLDPKKVNETSFEDLYPFVDHEDFEKNNYYMNFFHAVSREGKLFVIPATIFTHNLFMMRTDIAPDYVNRFMRKKDFNYNDLVEIYLEIVSEARERGEEWNILLEANFDPMQFLIHNLDSLIDFENKAAKFTDPEFMALMERVKNEVYYGDYITYSEDGITYSNYYKIHDFLDLNKCVEE